MKSKKSSKKQEVKKEVKQEKVVTKEMKDKALSAQAKLEAYMRANKLDPSKDWTKDKKHGEKIKELLLPLKTVRNKISEIPRDPVKPSSIATRAAKAKNKKEVTKYDYPKIDGREMTKEEKKKYRIKMRKQSGKPEPAPLKAPLKDKKVETKKVAKTESKPAKKDDKKAKAKTSKFKED